MQRNAENEYEALIQTKEALQATITAIDEFIGQQRPLNHKHRTAANACTAGVERMQRVLEEVVEDPPAPSKRRTKQNKRQAGEDVPEERPRTRSARQKRVAVNDDEEELQREEEEVEQAQPKGKKAALLSGSVARGPKNELVFYYQPENKNTKPVCDVYGNDQPRSFERRTLASCDFDDLLEPEKKWACLKLFEVFEEAVQRSTMNFCASNDPFQYFVAVHGILQIDDRIFLNEEANVKQSTRDDLMNCLRHAGRLSSNANACQKSIWYMMTAKLHSELKGLVEYGKLSSVFNNKLEEMRVQYLITDKIGTLKRYLDVGRLMLQCRALVFAPVSVLLKQQQIVEAVVNDDELGPKLLRLYEPRQIKAIGLGDSGLEANRNLTDVSEMERGGKLEMSSKGVVAISLNTLMENLCDAVESLEQLKLTQHLTAMQFAQILRMDFGNNVPVPRVRECVDITIVRVYMNLLNESLMKVGADEQCFLDGSIGDDASDMERVGVLFSSLSTGVLVTEDDVDVYCYRADAEQRSLHLQITEALKGSDLEIRDKEWSFYMIGGYEGIGGCQGLLHFLSEVVWREVSVDDEAIISQSSQQLLQLQVCLELYREEMIPRTDSLLDVIAREQSRLPIQVPECASKVDLTKIMQCGFLIVRNFVELDEYAVSQFCNVVKESADTVAIFQSAGENDNKRRQIEIADLSDRLNSLARSKDMIHDITRALSDVVGSRKVYNMVALLSLAGCGPQRSHTDYTQHDLDDLFDDGVCGGLPLGAIVALQNETLFDAWPGARGSRHDRFYEHVQFVLNAGDGLFFLGNSVHAGAAFEEENCRIHAYLESRSQHNNRAQDRTQFVDVQSGVATVLPRGVTFQN